MHDVLRERLLRKIESLPEEQIYQVLDYIEFLESKYARDLRTESTGLQRFAERMEDQLRRRAVSPATLREAFQLISAADRVLSNVSSAGRQIFAELGEGLAEGPGAPPGPAPGTEHDGGRGKSPPPSAAEAGGAPGEPRSGRDDDGKRGGGEGPDDEPVGGPGAP